MGFYQPHNCIYTYMHSIRQIIIVRLRYIITFHATASYETCLGIVRLPMWLMPRAQKPRSTMCKSYTQTCKFFPLKTSTTSCRQPHSHIYEDLFPMF